MFKYYSQFTTEMVFKNFLLSPRCENQGTGGELGQEVSFQLSEYCV